MGQRRGFSLIELVVVLVIIGLLAAVAVSRLGRMVESTNDAALQRNLQTLRKAIETYSAEHGAYPSAANIVPQLTGYTDAAGNLSAAKVDPFVYGPYLREVPPVPTGSARGSRGIAAARGAGVGWVYSEADGNIAAAGP